MNDTTIPYAFRDWLATPGPWRVAGHTSDRDGDYPIQGARGLVVSCLNTLCGGDEGRHAFLLFCFRKSSIKDLTVRQQNAIYHWLSPRKFDPDTPIPADYLTPPVRGKGGDWTCRSKCQPIAEAVVAAALSEWIEEDKRLELRDETAEGELEAEA